MERCIGYFNLETQYSATIPDKIIEYPTHTAVNFTQTLHSDICSAIDLTKSGLAQSGKVVLITGSRRGIGQSVALRSAECGVACIILCARKASELDLV